MNGRIHRFGRLITYRFRDNSRNIFSVMACIWKETILRVSTSGLSAPSSTSHTTIRLLRADAAGAHWANLPADGGKLAVAQYQHMCGCDSEGTWSSIHRASATDPHTLKCRQPKSGIVRTQDKLHPRYRRSP